MRRNQSESRIQPWIAGRLGKALGPIFLWARVCRPGAVKLAKALLPPGMALGLTACSSFRTEVGRPLWPAPSPLVAGETRVETVVHQLGPPHAISPLPGGFVFLYEYSRVSEFQWGIGLGLIHLPFFDYFKVISANSHLSESVNLLTFDEQGVLRAQGSATWREKLGGGQALQWVISVMSLTDTTAFRDLPDASLWGRALLQPPPVTLNSAQDLRTGASGVQQRLAPLFVGQATLEMNHPKPLKIRRQKMRPLGQTR